MKKILILLTLASAIQASQILAQEERDKPKEYKQANKEYFIQNLLKAAIDGNENQIRYLLENNSDIINQQTKIDALKIAIEYNHKNIMLLILNNPTIPYNERNQDLLEYWALYFASEYNREDMVKKLLETYVISPPQKTSALEIAAANHHQNIVKLLLKDFAKRTGKLNALEAAISKGNEKIIRISLSNENINEEDKLDALKMAITKGNENIIRILLSDDDKLFQKEALKFAAKHGYINIIKTQILYNKINNPNIKNQALKIATANHHQNIVKLLKNNL